MKEARIRKGLAALMVLSMVLMMLPVGVWAVGEPANPPTNAAFTDADINGGQISGDFTWTAAVDESDITGYKVYFWNGSKVGTVVGTVAKGGTNAYTFAANTAIPATATQLAVFAYNGVGEEITGSQVAIVDDNSGGVDMTALIAAINAEYSDGASRTTYVLTSTDYTGASWTAYTGAIAAAIVVEANDAATQLEVDNAAAAIGTAKSALTVDKTALTAAITAEIGADHSTPVYVLTSTDYTGASWTAYTGAIAAAIVVEADVAATQLAIDNAAAAIGTAKSALTVDKTALTAAITAEIGADHSTPVYVLTSTDYTGASWTAYTGAIAAAIVVEADVAATQLAIDNAAAAIGTAKSALTVDKTALTAAITAEIGADHSTPVYVLTSTDYTGASWTAYTGAIAAAIVVEADVAATQLAIDNAAAAIGTAKSALTADKTALTAAITAEIGADHSTPVYVLTSTDYTGASWTAYTGAIAAAIVVEADVAATQLAIDNAAAAIGTAKSALTADKTALTAAITAEIGADHSTPVYVLTSTDYTGASWTAYTGAIAAAIVVEADVAATQLGVDNAAAAIGTAKSALTADKTALTAAITAEIGADHSTPVYVLTSTDYTGASWTAYTGAIAAAIAVEADVAATQLAIDNAAAAIGTAKSALTVDKTALTAAITAEIGADHSTPVYVLISTDYTGASWTAYTGAIAAAIVVEADVAATQLGVDNAAAAIGTAKSALTVDKTALTAAITAEIGADHSTPVYVLTSTDYTGASWTAYTGAIAAAIVVEADVAATQLAIDNAAAAIGTAKSALTADKTALTAAITAEIGADHSTPVYVLTSTDYTGASWAAYTGAIAAAIVVEADVAATQLAVDNAAAAIGTAKTALVGTYTLSNTTVATVGGFKKTTVSVSKGAIAAALADARLLVVGERTSGGQACWVVDLATASGNGESTEISVTSGSFTTVKVYLVDGAPSWADPFTGVKADVLTITP